MIAIIILALIVIRLSFINAEYLSDLMSNLAKFMFYGMLCGFALFIAVDCAVRTNEHNIDGQTVSSYSIIDASDRFMYIANNDDTIKLSWEYVVSSLDNNHNGKDASAMRLIACDTDTKPHATLTKYHHTPNKISLMFYRDRGYNYITKRYDVYVPCGNRNTLPIKRFLINYFHPSQIAETPQQEHQDTTMTTDDNIVIDTTIVVDNKSAGNIEIDVSKTAYKGKHDSIKAEIKSIKAKRKVIITVKN